jgi:hypothetical protein
MGHQNIQRKSVKRARPGSAAARPKIAAQSLPHNTINDIPVDIPVDIPITDKSDRVMVQPISGRAPIRWRNR